LRLALDLHPSTRRVFVIANPTNPLLTGIAVRSALGEFSPRVALTYIEDRSLSGLTAAVKAVPAGSLVLYVFHAQSDPGNLVYPDQVAEFVARVSPVPVYGTSDFYIGRGVVGGVVRSTAETGTRLGDLAAEILNGTRASDLPIEKARIEPVVDWRQVKRWGIRASALPAGTRIEFKPPSVWESYRGYILGALIVITAQLTLIAALLLQHWRLRRAGDIIRARESTLRSSYQRIRQLAGRLIYAQESARATIARDLHDGVCQDLLGASVGINTLKTSAALRDIPSAQQELAQIETEVLGTYDTIRRLSHDLHPSTLRLVGLARALKSHCGEVAKRYGVQVDFSALADLGHLDLDVAVCFFRIAQESMRNGIVHGKATRLGVNLARAGRDVTMTVVDNGGGFDVEAIRTGGEGFGLVSMEERAHLFGGSVSVQSGPSGTTVTVRAPASAPGENTAAAG